MDHPCSLVQDSRRLAPVPSSHRWRPQRPYRGAPALVLVLLSACALPADGPAAKPSLFELRSRGAPAAPRSPQRTLPSGEAPAEGPAAAAPLPTGVVGLREALAAALRGNPDLAAFSWEVRAQEARALQAGRLPNPELATELEDFAGSGDRRGWESAQTTLSLSQLVELGGKRAKRRRVAALERDLAGWDYEARRLGVLADVTKAFVTLLEIQERLTLTEELARLAERILATVASTVKAGAVSPVEEARARVALSRASLDRAQLEHELDAARTVLAATWGAATVTFEGVRGDLRLVAPPPALEALLATLPQSPDLARWTTELEARKAALGVEEARRIPSPTVRLGGRHFADNDDGALVAEIGLPLPLFDRNQSGILEARRRLGKARAERAAAEAGARAQVVTTYRVFRAAYERARALEGITIPEAEHVHTGAVDAHSKGRYRYLEVLDAQRTLFELRGQYLQALADYHTAAADLERLTGAPLPGGHPEGELREEETR
jgi:cobalt-zinc-cadmium efflux system outer membrane protein